MSNIDEANYDLRILQALRRIIRAIELHSKKLTSQYKITPAQIICLQTIIKEGPLTLAAIASKVHLSPSTVVGIIDRLEEKKLVKREKATKDRRQLQILATEEGIEYEKSAPSPLQDKFAKALSKLSPLEQSTICLSLDRIVEMMELEELDAAPILETGVIHSSQESKS